MNDDLAKQRMERRLELERQGFPFGTDADLMSLVNPPFNPYCCHQCYNSQENRTNIFMTRMILCSICGNKRCPKATDHNLECTNSNEPNQVGSLY